MREIVSPLSGIRSPFGQLTSPLASYAVLGIKPELVFDFDADKYFVNSRRSTFSDSITHSRASTATYVDSTGTLQTAGINEPRIGHHIYNGSAWVNEGLLHESEARTQLLHTTNALVTQSHTVTAVPHTLHFTGTGTVTLSGASTAGPLVGTGTGEQNRVSLTFTPSATSLTLTVSGTLTDAQLEVGSTPSSYIPNLAVSGTVTRAAETLTVPAANMPWSSSAVSIQMDGRMTYADEGASTEIRFWRWRAGSPNQILSRIDASGSLVGRYITQQTASGTYDQTTDSGTEAYAPGINVPFNIASRHGSTFINAAADGTSYVANTTPVALPDLSATNFELGHDYMGTIKQLRVWPKDLADAGIVEATDPTFTTEFAMLVTTTTANETFTIPCQNVGTFDAGIEWGDGGVSSITAYNDSALTHTYASAGDHIVRIRGTFPNIYFNDGGDKLKVTKVLNLGQVGWGRLDEAFLGCSNMTEFTAGTTDTSAVTNMANMFNKCSSLTSLNLSSLNTSSAINMAAMFRNCSGLTSLNVSNFNTSSTTNINSMFRNCTSLTSLNVSNFNTSSAINMSSMFNNCTSLTSLNVSNFNTSSVANMSSMFRDCSSLTSLVGPEDFDIEGLNETSDLNSFATNVPNGALDYDTLLVNWDAQDPFDGMAPDFGGSKYSAGAPATARANLISTDSWTITDGGPA